MAATPEEFEIYIPDHLKSNVWRYFGFPKEQGKITTKDKVICSTKLTYHVTTNSLRAHLSTLHHSKLEEEEEPGRGGPEFTPCYLLHEASAITIRLEQQIS